MYILIKTNHFIPAIANAITIYPFILIRPEKFTPDILVHEETHIRQFQKQPIIWWFRYLFSKEFKLKEECEAYANQIAYLVKHGGDKEALISSFIGNLLTGYNLTYSENYIRGALEVAVKAVMG